MLLKKKGKSFIVTALKKRFEKQQLQTGELYVEKVNIVSVESACKTAEGQQRET